MSRAPPVTADDLLHLHLSDKRAELVRGVLVVREPAGYLHGLVTARLGSRLTVHVEAHGLGCVLAAETGFRLASDPDTVRAPDVAPPSATASVIVMVISPRSAGPRWCGW
ncbi:MAG TPA: Uma2 family endonuclease [Gemmatimonadales bacterium]